MRIWPFWGWDAPAAQLTDLVVAPGLRGDGVGARLVLEFERRTGAAGGIACW